MAQKTTLYILVASASIVIAAAAVYFTVFGGAVPFINNKSEPAAVLPKPLDVAEKTRLPVQPEIVPPEAELEPPESEIIPPAPKEEPKSPADTKPKEKEPVQEFPVPVAPEEPQISSPKPKLHIVFVEDGVFIPKNLTITVGDTIRWINNDTKLRWPSADPHPTHSALPEFDPLADLAPGENYSFTFTEVGVVPYHDHTQAIIEDIATITGTIIVLPPK